MSNWTSCRAIQGVIVLVISNRPRASRSPDFEITREITPWIVLHSLQLLLLIGHASDKSIESCSARPTIQQQFESSVIVSRFIATFPCSCFFLKLFRLWQWRPRLQRNQLVYQQSTFNINRSSAPDFTHSVFHGWNFFSSPRNDIWMIWFFFVVRLKQISFDQVKFLNSGSENMN